MCCCIFHSLRFYCLLWRIMTFFLIRMQSNEYANQILNILTELTVDIEWFVIVVNCLMCSVISGLCIMTCLENINEFYFWHIFVRNGFKCWLMIQIRSWSLLNLLYFVKVLWRVYFICHKNCRWSMNMMHIFVIYL